jgi:hypothetical protein
MHAEPIQVLQSARLPGLPQRQRRLVIAGATGVMGNEVLRRLAGRFDTTLVLAREAITDGLGMVTTNVVPSSPPAQWPTLSADTAIILFDPPRLFHDRERALWTPAPEQLLEVAQWLCRCGVTTLAVVLPHAQGRLPEALKRGLANLDEQAVAALGFGRLLFIRSAQKPGPMARHGFLSAVAHRMLAFFKYMVPSSEQPVRAANVAEFLAHALQLAPPGIHVAPSALVWQAAQGDPQRIVRQWLRA